jgi:hypothetical protein
VAGVYLFLVKEMKILLVDEETVRSYVLVVVRYWLIRAEGDMDGRNEKKETVS